MLFVVWHRVELLLEIICHELFGDWFVKVVCVDFQLTYGSSFSVLTVVVLLPGEVQYARNGHHVTTLMHVDTSLPLWAFLDIYGTMKEIKSIGKHSACIFVSVYLRHHHHHRVM